MIVITRQTDCGHSAYSTLNSESSLVNKELIPAKRVLLPAAWLNIKYFKHSPSQPIAWLRNFIYGQQIWATCVRQ